MIQPQADQPKQKRKDYLASPEEQADAEALARKLFSNKTAITPAVAQTVLLPEIPVEEAARRVVDMPKRPESQTGEAQAA